MNQLSYHITTLNPMKNPHFPIVSHAFPRLHDCTMPFFRHGAVAIDHHRVSLPDQAGANAGGGVRQIGLGGRNG